MHLRVAELADIPALHALRLSVRENVLRDPTRVALADYERFLSPLGIAWVVEEGCHILGFAMADRAKRSVWALFVAPSAERRGVGRKLLERLTDDLMREDVAPIMLSTDSGTRAEKFYRAAGWKAVGMLGNGEIQFAFTPTTV